MNILVVGDAMIDRSIFGNIERISPEAPVPILLRKDSIDSLGGAANVASSLSTFGANVALLSSYGNDEAGSILKSLCTKAKLNLITCPTIGHTTTTKVRFWSSNQQVFRYDHESNFVDSNALSSLAIEQLNSSTSYDCIVISDYDKGVVTMDLVRSLTSYASTNNLKTICDPKGDNCDKYYGVSVITPNLKEACALTKIDAINGEDKKLYGILLKLTRKFDITQPIITLGKRGMCYLSPDGNLTFQEPIKTFLADPTGAGDTAIAALTYSLCLGYSFSDSVRYACAAASYTVTHVGTAPCPYNELEARYKQLLAQA